jgi:hypothetical protein
MVALVVGLLAGSVVAAGLVATGCLSVRRHSRRHVTAHVAIGQRGLFFSRTPDGVWWRLRLRPCDRRYEDRSGWGDPPPDARVREPRRPLGTGPRASAVRLDPPCVHLGPAPSTRYGEPDRPHLTPA